MQQPFDLSVVIVAFGAADYLERCLATVARAAASTRRSVEVLVVDNHSPDDALARARRACPSARVIALPVNVGFGAANNIGSLAASGRHLVLLNPDTEIAPGVLDALIDALERYPECGVVAPRLDNSDGSLQVSCYRFPTAWNALLDGTPVRWLHPFGRHGAHRYCDPSDPAPRDVEWASGACLAMSRELFESLDGFDERFFMYSEDVDLCRRVADRGLSVRYLPGVRVVHHVNRSEGTISDAVVERSARSAVQYQRVAAPRRSPGWFAAALLAGSWLGAITSASARVLRPELGARIRARQQWRRRLALAVWRAWRAPRHREPTSGLLRVKRWLRSQSSLARSCDRLLRSTASVAIASFERLRTILPQPDVAQAKREIREVVITSFYGLGDALMDQPAMAALRQVLPDAYIRVLCSRRHAELLAGQDLADEIEPVDEARFFEVAREVARHKPDLFVILQSSLEFYLFGRLCGARFLAGYLWDYRAARASGFRAASRPNTSRSRVARGLEVPALFGAPVRASSQPRWTVSPGDAAAANALLGRYDLASGDRFVAVNPNKTASWLGAGRWPPQRWRRVVKTLRDVYGVPVVLVGSGAERSDVEAIVAGFAGDSKVLNLAGAATLRETAGIFSRATLVITTDSGLMHLAGAVGAPVISLFTFSDPASFATGVDNHVVRGVVPCSPCIANQMAARDNYPPICPYDYRCGRALTADAVTGMLARLLAAEPIAGMRR